MIHCRNKLFRTVVVLLLAVAASAAQATSIYKWLDDDGQIHYSHTVPPEVVRKEHQRLNNQAVVMEHVESADVPNMLAELELSQEQKARRIEKRLLLATYNSVADIAEERDKSLAWLDKEQQITERYLNLLTDRLREARYFYSRLSDGEGLAISTMQSTIDSLNQSIRQQKQRQFSIEKKRQLVNNQYAIEVSRYNEALALSESNQLDLKLPALDY